LNQLPEPRRRDAQRNADAAAPVDGTPPADRFPEFAEGPVDFQFGLNPSAGDS